MKFITIATHSSPAFEIFQRSAEYHEIEVDILGWGREYTSHSCKSLWIIEYLETLPDDEIVLYTDGYDAFFLAPEPEILEKFRNFGHPFVISAEQNLNVVSNLFSKLAIYRKLPKGKKPYQFLNAGQWIGEAKVIKEVLAATLDPKKFDQRKLDDQSTLNEFLSLNPDSLKLDDENVIFSCTAGRTGLVKEDYTVQNDRINNILTGSFPCLIHFAGENFEEANSLLKNITYLENHLYEQSTDRFLWYQFKNKLIDRTCRDNFLFHFAVHSFTIIAFMLFLGYLFFSFF